MGGNMSRPFSFDNYKPGLILFSSSLLVLLAVLLEDKFADFNRDPGIA